MKTNFFSEKIDFLPQKSTNKRTLYVEEIFTPKNVE